MKRIYTISFLAGNTYATKHYHQIGKLRNQYGELIDEQMTHVIVELAKFNKTEAQITSDLDKLLYIMKFTEQTTLDKPIQFPKFWDEEWIQIAIDVLDKSNMSPEKRADFEMTLAYNASMVYAYEEEKKRQIEQAVRRQKQIAKQQIEQQKQIAKQQVEIQKQIAKQQIEQQTISAVKKMLDMDIAPATIAIVQGISLEKVVEIQKQSL